jgi:hypothetical protein
MKRKPPINPELERRRRYEAEKLQWLEMKASFVTNVHVAYLRNPWLKRYAYIQPSDVGKWAALATFPEGEEPAAGYELISAEHVPAGTKQQISAWFERFADRLPVYPLEAR